MVVVVYVNMTLTILLQVICLSQLSSARAFLKHTTAHNCKQA